jgi:hypothetical protein
MCAEGRAGSAERERRGTGRDEHEDCHNHELAPEPRDSLHVVPPEVRWAICSARRFRATPLPIATD